VRIGEPLNKATWKGVEYSKEQGKASEAFFLKNMCTEPLMPYPRADRTFALKVDAWTSTDNIEGGMVQSWNKLTKKEDST
jgi:hypothetical protein